MRLGDRHRDLKDFDAERADAERMLAIRPRSPRGRRMLGRYYYEKVERDFDRALAEYAKAVELDPEDPNSYQERGWVSRPTPRVAELHDGVATRDPILQ